MYSAIKYEHGARRVDMPNGETHLLREYPIDETEITDNGDGTFSIPNIKSPKHGEYAYTVDGKRLFVYSGGTNVWYEW